jgi:hypothetical protein
VSHFVNRFFDQALAKQIVVGRKTIKFLPQPVR